MTSNAVIRQSCAASLELPFLKTFEVGENYLAGRQLGNVIVIGVTDDYGFDFHICPRSEVFTSNLAKRKLSEEGGGLQVGQLVSAVISDSLAPGDQVKKVDGHGALLHALNGTMAGEVAEVYALVQFGQSMH